MIPLTPGTRVHFIGIGGAGLSAIARILMERGCAVSGSDTLASEVTEALAADGAQVFHGHRAEYVSGADLVLATSAVADDHVEVAAAEALGIPVFRRQAFMPGLLQGCDTIAVAGTHGKTTTTSMIVHIMAAAGKSPSYIVGGAMGNTGKNAAVGRGNAFVIEADEYDNMFHGLDPNLAVVTNVEHDHPDLFETADALTAAFKRFVDLLGSDGLLVACADDPGARALAESRRRQGLAVRSYSADADDADWRATDLDFTGALTRFTVIRHGVALGDVSLCVPGRHNVLNALAALAATHERGVAFEQGAAALSSFIATARRFEVRGARQGVIVVDDYAHHPTEISVNIQAARLRYPKHQIWVVWQPHTYSRVKQFWAAFVASFAEADQVLITPIYAARESPVEGVTSAALAAELQARQSAAYIPAFDDAVDRLVHSASAPAVVLIFSAGDANIIADKFLNHPL
ncbi:MAG: UDP-N-acetylmuramate--L-alanine ligase [Chloroflexi bacterium]|nr:UDP-N-acetylmuramate--L-alanine ligase [Chloroflexota bacterium]